MKRLIAIFMTVCLVFGLASMSAWATEEPTWQEETPMPAGLQLGTSCTIGDKIYVIGGREIDEIKRTVNIYDTKTDTWSTCQSMPTARYGFTSTVIGNKIYVIGGYNGKYLNTIEIYDITTDTWSTGQPMPTARFGLTSSVVGDKICVIGGYDSQQGTVDVVEIYDSKTDTWSIGQSMPTAKQNLTSSVIGNKIYAIGGYDLTTIYDTVEIYDLQSDTWSTSAPMPTARFHLTSSVSENKIYAIGGLNVSNQAIDTVEIYDVQTDTWSTGTPLTTARGYLMSSVVGNKIYTIGGSNKSNSLATVESLEVGSTKVDSPLLSVLLNIGETVQLSTSYDLGNNKNFTWSSTNESVAVVDENGKVTAIAEGTANIYAQNADGSFKEYIPIKVVDGIADELRLAVHLKTTESANLYLADDPNTVTWSSMDDSIAFVSADGKVTAVKKGLAIIKGELDGTSYQIYVRVNN
ncbi:kelch repeat-containing protein [Sinanaerobacter sp. ZZT-01]|uniref:Kelch repeat-containing protein n=1 Tax=Sinanaerobacter sp. ZZT-01 TaxID=3111540 RepID=UPI002D7840E4|nr:kelch repeat-containing protein [Sinanaerobacter sp. ZZT-01]WRR92876.1 kelch repeat-containing protein [Sinanaerobacter sp. ZZT-01]